MTASQVIIHTVLPALAQYPAEHLTDSEKRRAAKFHFTQDADRWTACRSALRTILGELCEMPPNLVPIELTATGKPVLAPPFDQLHFNLSHCHDLALIAISRSPVGVDIEPLARATDLLECESTFCHPDEIAALPPGANARAQCLLEIWTAKEAVLKALGTGLLQPPEEVTLDFKGDAATARCDRPLENLSGQRILRLRHPGLSGHCAFVAASRSISEILYRPSQP